MSKPGKRVPLSPTEAKPLIKGIVENFKCDGSTDYRRMEVAVLKATGLLLDNASLWSLINKAKARSGGAVDRVSFTLDD